MADIKKYDKRTRNLPTVQPDGLPPSTIHEITAGIIQLNALGKCRSDAELEDRIQKYFTLCQESSMRPGIESLCVACHCSRSEFFEWSRGGKGATEHRTEICQNAKRMVGAILEQMALQGKLNPATAIFWAKNVLAYKDTVSIEALSEENTPNRLTADSAEQIAAKYADQIEEAKESPMMLPLPHGDDDIDSANTQEVTE